MELISSYNTTDLRKLTIHFHEWDEFFNFYEYEARVKIMRIHAHEWKLITLIFENQLNYALNNSGEQKIFHSPSQHIKTSQQTKLHTTHTTKRSFFRVNGNKSQFITNLLFGLPGGDVVHKRLLCLYSLLYVIKN